MPSNIARLLLLRCLIPSVGRQFRAARDLVTSYKIPFVAAVSLSDDGHPLRAKLSPVPGVTLQAIAQWASLHLAPGSSVRSDGLACFSAVTAAGCTHQPTVHAFDFGKYAARYLAAFAYRFNRRFDLAALHERLLAAAARCGPHPERLVRLAEGHC